MSGKKRLAKWVILGLGIGLIGMDLMGVGELDSQVEMIVPRVDKEMLGTATVAVATSQDLAEPVALDQELTSQQVDTIVKHAIALDQSATNLDATIEPGDWVAIKVNIVTAAIVINGKQQTSFWDSGIPHWGQETDLRVVRSVIDYLVNTEKDASHITIVEGGAEWSKLGEAGTDPDQEMDGWTVEWEKFDNLSYVGIVDEFDGVNGITVDIVDLNYDDWMGTEGVRAGDPLPVPDPNQTGVGGFQRPEDGYYVSKTLLDVDKLIGIPAMKTHDIPGITLLHKLYVGTYMQRAYGARNNSKMGLHNFIRGVGNEQVPAGFVDMFTYRPVDYGIIEGFWGTEGRGPQWGKNVNHNVVIASGNPVAADAVGAVVMDYNPEDLWYLKYSAAKGFGTYDLNNITVVGTQPEAVQRRWEKTPNPNFWGWGNRQFLVSGPFETESLEDEPLANAPSLKPVEGQEMEGMVWEKVEGIQAPHKQYVAFPESHAASMSANYAFTYVYSDRDQEGFLYLGTGNDEVEAWVNGEEALVSTSPVASKPDAVQAPIALQKGMNTVMVKVRNRFGGTGLSMVAGDQDGDTLPGIQYLLAPEGPATAVTEEADAEGRPVHFKLGRNYPNPFNPETMIPYELPQHTPVRLTIYSVLGTKVRTLVDRGLTGGSHVSRWDGRDDAGRAVSSGVYLYRLAMPGAERTGRMTLVR